MKCSTSKKPAFSLDDGLGFHFLHWLATPCGGHKCKREANQIARRAMKFLKASMGEQQEENVSDHYADCCLGSPSIIISFLRLITEYWLMSSSGALNYMKSIGDLMDFRKSGGISDEVLRSFAVTEVYIRRGRENLSRQKKMDYGRNLQLEKLIARNSWASTEEMEKVIPYHSPKYETILDICLNNDSPPTISQLAFSTRFIITLLFLRVKCTRPMSYQYLTLEMVEDAKLNGGFIDQTTFKTHERYTFDTLVLTDAVLQILDSYKENIRPLCNPSCDYFVITTTGTQYTSFSTAMSLLVHEAIGKHVNPTRYRQIVETTSNDVLSEKERDTISKDQKHSSHVAKRVYQKQLSRQVAVSGKACMEKILGKGRDEHTKEFALSVSKEKSKINEGSGTSSHLLPSPSSINVKKVFYNDGLECRDEEVEEGVVVEIKDDEEETQHGSNGSMHCEPNNDCVLSSISPLNIDLEVKREEAEEHVRHGTTSMKRFSPEEDKYLRLGVAKYGNSSWSKILHDKNNKFNPSRNRDSLRMRAKTLKIIKKAK